MFGCTFILPNTLTLKSYQELQTTIPLPLVPGPMKDRKPRIFKFILKTFSLILGTTKNNAILYWCEECILSVMQAFSTHFHLTKRFSISGLHCHLPRVACFQAAFQSHYWKQFRLKTQKSCLYSILAQTPNCTSQSRKFVTRNVIYTSSSSDGDSDRDVAYMDIALKEARKAFKANEVPIGAVLTDDTGHRVLSSAHNLVESSGDCTQHAEMVCIRQAMTNHPSWRLQNTVLYSTLEPCAMCLSAILLARVGRIVFAARDLRLGACGSWVNLLTVKHPFHTFSNVTSGVLADESAALLREFFKKRRTEAPRFKKWFRTLLEASQRHMCTTKWPVFHRELNAVSPTWIQCLWW